MCPWRSRRRCSAEVSTTQSEGSLSIPTSRQSTLLCMFLCTISVQIADRPLRTGPVHITIVGATVPGATGNATITRRIPTVIRRTNIGPRRSNFIESAFDRAFLPSPAPICACSNSIANRFHVLRHGHNQRPAPSPCQPELPDHQEELQLRCPW